MVWTRSRHGTSAALAAFVFSAGVSAPAAGGVSSDSADVTSPPRTAPERPTPYPLHCQRWSGAVKQADLLLAGRWQIGWHPEVKLPLDRSWREDPLGDTNWEFGD